MNKWNQAGVYDEQTGLFYIREGEHVAIQSHFKLLKLNRMQVRKSVFSYAHKSAAEQPTYIPKISEKTKKYAESKRQKLIGENKKVDLVQILLCPENTKGKNPEKLEKIKKDKEEKELAELTFHPVTNLTGERPNKKKFEDLYKQSKVHLRKDKSAIDYDFEKNSKECSFKPTINTYRPKKSKDIVEEPRKKLEERVNECLAKKQEHLAKIASESDLYNPCSNVTYANKYFGGVDSAQIKP